MGWPALAPAVLALAIALRPGALRHRAAEPWAAWVVVGSATIALATGAGVIVAGGWIVLAAVVAAVAATVPIPVSGRPDAADLVALVGWAGAFVLRPEMISGGTWLSAGVLLLGARRLVTVVVAVPTPSASAPLPPSREVRGTLSLRGIVVGDGQGLPLSAPLDLDLRAGDSLAVLCRSQVEAAALAMVVAGRSRPRDGEVVVDGVPVEEDDLLVAVIAAGEPFVAGDLEENLAALSGEVVDGDALAGVFEACSLDRIRAELGDRSLGEDGEPLDELERLVLLAARVIPSDFRIVVVVDPAPWADARGREWWRRAVVRASVGRTALWLTRDRDLAARADQVMEWSSGALRRVGDESHGDGGAD
jgi:ABC-type protease/lipase transport system fused ATPase/permease subunit